MIHGWLMLVAGAVAMAGMMPGAAHAAEAPPMSRATIEAQRSALGAFTNLEAVIDRWIALPEQPRDFRKTTAADDLRNYVLPVAVRNAMPAMRAEADRLYAARDWAGAALYYDKLLFAATTVAERYQAVHAYWFFIDAQEQQQRLWRIARREYVFDDPNAAKLAELQQVLEDRVRQGDFMAAQREGIVPFNQLFAQSVQVLRDRIGEQTLDPDPLRRVPKSRCKATWDTESGDDEAKLTVAPKLDVARSRRSAAFYPREARQLGMVGKTTVRAQVSETGCVAWGEVAESSGHLRLDEAALDWAVEGAVFRPAQSGRKPVSAIGSFVVRFSIPDP